MLRGTWSPFDASQSLTLYNLLPRVQQLEIENLDSFHALLPSAAVERIAPT